MIAILRILIIPKGHFGCHSNTSYFVEKVMGNTMNGNETGWDSVNDLIHYHERGNGLTINNKPSYDINQAGLQIARGDKTWNGVHVTGKEATVTYSFPDWDYNELNLGHRSPERDTG
ncbi:hypothetical protein M8494_11155 [Serratia ureilytica]